MATIEIAYVEVAEDKMSCNYRIQGRKIFLVNQRPSHNLIENEMFLTIFPIIGIRPGECRNDFPYIDDLVD